MDALHFGIVDSSAGGGVEGRKHKSRVAQVHFRWAMSLGRARSIARVPVVWWARRGARWRRLCVRWFDQREPPAWLDRIDGGAKRFGRAKKAQVEELAIQGFATALDELQRSARRIVHSSNIPSPSVCAMLPAGGTRRLGASLGVKAAGVHVGLGRTPMEQVPVQGGQRGLSLSGADNEAAAAYSGRLGKQPLKRACAIGLLWLAGSHPSIRNAPCIAAPQPGRAAHPPLAGHCLSQSDFASVR